VGFFLKNNMKPLEGWIYWEGGFFKKGREKRKRGGGGGGGGRERKKRELKLILTNKFKRFAGRP